MLFEQSAVFLELSESFITFDNGFRAIGLDMVVKILASYHSFSIVSGYVSLTALPDNVEFEDFLPHFVKFG